ncbi:hypothetical protein V6N11_062005 [Hibiscus sabdariffa]|uniref:Uncharacterized protein n=1 Tax=Hibiscus sabdariffa TaxID=183260 RepID=A0ABR2PRL9_9ROSI
MGESPGGRIVSYLIWQFSLQQRLKFNVDVVESEWGQGANLHILAEKLTRTRSRLFASFTTRLQPVSPTTWLHDTVTAALVPPYIDSTDILKRAWKRYNLSFGLGLNKVAGKVFGIGNLNELQLLGCLAGVEMIGYPVKLGSGVVTACAYLESNIPLIPSRI